MLLFLWYILFNFKKHKNMENCNEILNLNSYINNKSKHERLIKYSANKINDKKLEVFKKRLEEYNIAFSTDIDEESKRFTSHIYDNKETIFYLDKFRIITFVYEYEFSNVNCYFKCITNLTWF